jgi:hypothetical protein
MLIPQLVSQASLNHNYFEIPTVCIICRYWGWPSEEIVFGHSLPRIIPCTNPHLVLCVGMQPSQSVGLGFSLYIHFILLLTTRVNKIEKKKSFTFSWAGILNQFLSWRGLYSIMKRVIGHPLSFHWSSLKVMVEWFVCRMDISRFGDTGAKRERVG